MSEDEVSIDDFTPEQFKQLQAEVEGRRLRELRYTCDYCGYKVSGVEYEAWDHCPGCGRSEFSEVTEDASV